MNYSADFLKFCTAIELRLTSSRKSVLFVLWKMGKPLKAYEILHALAENQLNLQATTVYRVLDYFLACKIVHKIESMQAYTLCHAPTQGLSSEVILICQHCHGICEVHDKKAIAGLEQLAEQNQFHLGQDVIELKGICQACKIEGSV